MIFTDSCNDLNWVRTSEKQVAGGKSSTGYFSKTLSSNKHKLGTMHRVCSIVVSFVTLLFN